MVFKTKKDLADAERRHKERNKRIWSRVEPQLNADGIRKLTEFFDET